MKRICGLFFLSLWSTLSISATQMCSIGQPLWPLLNANVERGMYRISANQIAVDSSQKSIAKGEVSVQANSSQLMTDTLIFNPVDQSGSAYGAVSYQTEQLFVSATQGDFQFDAQTAQLSKPAYLFVSEGARGSAESMDIGEQGVFWLYRANITTCPKKRDGWLLSAKKIKVDNKKEWVTAEGVVLRFKSVPIFYSPYLSFSLTDKRKTGFLLPGVAATEKSGFEFTVPFYWDIATNKDMTLSLRHMQKRGQLLETNFRYIDRYQQGHMELEYLPDDRLQSSARGRFVFEQTGAYPRGWSSAAKLNYVSDKNYFVDLGESLGVVSQTHLERSLTAGLARSNYSFLFKVQDYQTLDENILPQSRPYQRLPQIKINMHNSLLPGLKLGARVEAVSFKRDNSVEGTRVYLEPRLIYVKKTAALFFSPRLGISHTAYFLENTDSDATLSRTVPSFDLRGRLLFERPVYFGETAMTQTLEPEIYYLYRPFRKQSQLPVFDTTAFDFNFGQLFRSNRFSGLDRIGDANQMSIALTSSLLRNEDGRERLKLSVGQIKYFRDRGVVLPGESIAVVDESDIIFNLNSQLAHHLEISSQVQWDTRQDTAGKSTFRATYRKGSDRFFTLAYRFRKQQLEQTDLAFVWPVSRWLKGIARWHYSLPEKRTLNTLLGLQYNSCCWAASLFMTNFSNARSEEATQVIFLQLELKGLSSLGSRIDRVLRQEIPSYQ